MAPGGLLATLAIVLAMAAGGCSRPSDPPVAPSSCTPIGHATSWVYSTASPYRGQTGSCHQYECPPDGTFGSLWGSGPYTDDSSVCTAAVHAGRITRQAGGTVRAETRPGQASYEASTAHGVTSAAYGSYEGSFVVL